MHDTTHISLPPQLEAILTATETLGFNMACDILTGNLLRTLARSKPSGQFLELGTGTGVSTAWLLEGMDTASRLVSVEWNVEYIHVAQHYLGHDPRVQFMTQDGNAFLGTLGETQFDFIFADTWPGKYDNLELALHAVKSGGLYIIDDMLPQPNWPQDHPPKVARLINTLEQNPDLYITKINWSSGLIICTKK